MWEHREQPTSTHSTVGLSQAFTECSDLFDHNNLNSTSSLFVVVVVVSNEEPQMSPCISITAAAMSTILEVYIILNKLRCIKQYVTIFPMARCTYLLRLRRSCQPCDRVTPNEVCRKYELCAECNLEADGCVSCPQGYYGRWCNNGKSCGYHGIAQSDRWGSECNCQNGGQCHQYEGYCMCPPNYEGEFCQVATGKSTA
ncbi:hypothetical protein LAZ67_21000677 [Cordylochernes scorpioides]|uniref:EGF-like domain-containing protein n=1 Tax=Cordylochernes scorpioides TaxID=51811 RepID=A0ABY6LMF7_9ARAC|nr:hypothetical protein LAZ67_21000677 [Cordylochernes scorpioides]